MAKNANLSAAKAAKNDEFYTRREDIENELAHYIIRKDWPRWTLQQVF